MEKKKSFTEYRAITSAHVLIIRQQHSELKKVSFFKLILTIYLIPWFSSLKEKLLRLALIKKWKSINKVVLSSRRREKQEHSRKENLTKQTNEMINDGFDSTANDSDVSIFIHR